LFGRFYQDIVRLSGDLELKEAVCHTSDLVKAML
jgi:hypothetical protein